MRWTLIVASCFACAPVEPPAEATPPRAPAPIPPPVPSLGPSAADLVAGIDRTVDPSFVYDYDQTRFVPPDGQTLLMMGQTVEDIADYQASFADEPPPAGWMAYWGVPSFEGVAEPADNGFGLTQHHQMLVDDFPNAVVQSAMWMVGTWDVARLTAEGEYDAVLDQYAAWAMAIERPLFLRIGYEFDGPHNELDPVEYVAAYRHVVDRMRAAGVDNIAYVWHSYASPPFGGHPVSAWYPGDDYVDWVGISVFGHIYGGPSLGGAGDAVLDFARDHRKPVMIAESSPIRGIATAGTQAWNDWFVHYFSLVHRKNIRAISFISTDWTQLDIAGIASWEDARLTNNPTIAEAWFLEVEGERYLKASPALYPALGQPLSTP
ncbi:MAG: glycosyl hydrolase [Myxococcota bacterium]